MAFKRIATLKTVADFTAYLSSLGLSLPFDEEVQSGDAAPLAQPYFWGDKAIGNRFAVLPMQGWDSTPDGRPSELTRRRWRRFGLSGAKLIWGGEAVAVSSEGRDSPDALLINDDTVEELAELRELLVSAHAERFGRSDDLLVGLQLTHAGRFAKPSDKKVPQPLILYHHPILDVRFGLPAQTPLMTDDEVSLVVEDFVKASVLAGQAGFDFVDVRHCHGYLAHEFLSAVNRLGRYGGSLENRCRFLKEIVAGIRAKAPGMGIGVRLSAYDFIPFQSGKDGLGEAVPFHGSYPYAFGSDATGLGIDLAEPLAFLDLLMELDIKLVCITVGCPYYNYHIQRPTIKPPFNGYLPPEDPLVGVARMLSVAEELKQQRPQLIFVGSGYSYLQQWLPNVAQAVVRSGGADFVGIGRMSLSYPDIVADILEGKPLQKKRICRNCGDCTDASRGGLISGCFSLDEFYRERPEFKQLKRIRRMK